jgi:hypothetical protein
MSGTDILRKYNFLLVGTIVYRSLLTRGRGGGKIVFFKIKTAFRPQLQR